MSSEEHELGNRHFRMGEFLKAFDLYSDAIKNQRELLQTCLNLGLIHYRVQDYEYAIQYCLVSIALDQNCFPAWKRICFCLEKLQEYDACFYLVQKLKFKKKRLVKKLKNKRPKEMTKQKFTGLISQYFSLIPRPSSESKLSFENAMNYALHGRACVSSGQPVMAVGFYSIVLEYFVSQHASVLFSNRAASSLAQSESVSDFYQAYLDASAAVTLDKSNLKGHYRRTKALVNLGQHTSALVACHLGLKQKPGEPLLLELQQQIQSFLEYQSLHKHKSLYDVASETDEFQIIRRILGKIHSLKRFVDPRVPQFSKQLVESIDHPGIVSFEHEAHNLITSAPDHARVYLGFEGLIVSDRGYREHCHVLVLNRYKQDIEWWARAQLADINPKPIATLDEDPVSFSGFPTKQELLTMNTTHVSINAVDLSLLLFAHYDQPKQGHLKVIQISNNPYVVAKTLVIYEMLQRNATVDQIVQVWFSSVWSRRTLAVFKQCVLSVLVNFSTIAKQFGNNGKQVLAYLKRWQITDVALHRAHKLWFESMDHHFAVLCNYADQEDRKAVGEYYLTGALGKGEVGSVVMFALFPGEKKRRNESVLQLIPADILWETRESAPNLMRAAILCLQSRMIRLMDHVRQRRIMISVRHMDFSQYTQVIRRLDAWTMYWHNTCDYYEKDKFNRLCSACSGSSTIHTLASGLWTKSVKGSSLFDYQDQKERMQMLQASKNTVLSLTKTHDPKRKQVLMPPIGNPLFYTEHCLSALSSGLWAEHFLDGNIGTVDVSSFDLKDKYPCVIYCTWTYDPSVVFKKQQKPVE
ncbi:hypothetical protein EDD86DRAFT_214630 [Gorgonomyces haynaldii]|nr:hypothetical protein EDD86DRAFT_214630 [Gorgonomyces haynaldii]